MARQPEEPDERILSVFLKLADPPFSTRQIESELKIEYQGTYDRLKDLESRGFVKGRKYGTALAWTITDRGRDFLAGELDANDLKDSG